MSQSSTTMLLVALQNLGTYNSPEMRFWVVFSLRNMRELAYTQGKEVLVPLFLGETILQIVSKLLSLI